MDEEWEMAQGRSWTKADIWKGHLYEESQVQATSTNGKTALHHMTRQQIVWNTEEKKKRLQKNNKNQNK